MLRRTKVLNLRMPKARRTCERAWEVYNLRNYGIKEGGQNFRSWGLGVAFLFLVTCFETYNYWLRMCARGDTCPACEEIREQRRMRTQLLEKNSGIA
jgi:hypothetical protein